MDWLRAACALVLAIAFAPPADAYYCYSSVVVCQVAPPTVLLAQQRTDGIHLQWLEPVDGSVDAYILHRTSLLTGVTQDIPVGASRSYVDRPTEPGPFLYVVTALRDGEESLPSNPAGALGYPYCDPADVMPSAQVYEGCLWPLPEPGLT